MDRMIEKLQSCARSIQSFIPLDLFSTKKGSAAGIKIRTDLVQRMDVWVKERMVLCMCMCMCERVSETES